VYKRQIYQIAESNRIETFFARIGMLYYTASVAPVLLLLLLLLLLVVVLVVRVA